MVRCAITLAMLTLFARTVEANVSLENGNFYIGYTDVVYPGGFEPKVERVYNAKSGFRGIYGWGWGCEFEVFLEVSGDGVVVLHEYGGGAENIFTAPGHPTAKEIEDAVTLLVKARAKPESEAGAYQTRLVSDANFRHDEWAAMVKEKKVPRREIPMGTELVSERFGHQTLTRTPEGFRRVFDSKRVELYDVEGRLTRVTDPNNHFLQFTRDKKGRIASIEDDASRKIAFSYTPKGLVSGLVATDGKRTRRATYRYSKADDLIYSKDVDGNVYQYAYDRIHNLVEIRYSDNTTMAIGYHSRDRNDSVSTVKERDGTLTAYSYFNDGLNDFVAIESVDHQGAVLTASRYQYVRSLSNSGQKFTEHMVTEIDGERTATTYDVKCRQPLRIERGSDVSVFEYDDQCHVTLKDTPYEKTRLSYDSRAGKVSRVERQATGSKQTTWSAFRYDDRSNLIYAEDSEGTQLALEYDDFGRIAVLRQAKPEPRVIKFTYNQASKPIAIEAEGIGTIRVKYSAAGEIEKVESDGGRNIALQITSAFQNLLDVIRPAGVSLSF